MPGKKTFEEEESDGFEIDFSGMANGSILNMSGNKRVSTKTTYDELKQRSE